MADQAVDLPFSSEPVFACWADIVPDLSLDDYPLFSTDIIDYHTSPTLELDNYLSPDSDCDNMIEILQCGHVPTVPFLPIIVPDLSLLSVLMPDSPPSLLSSTENSPTVSPRSHLSALTSPSPLSSPEDSPAVSPRSHNSFLPGASSASPFDSLPSSPPPCEPRTPISSPAVPSRAKKHASKRRLSATERLIALRQYLTDEQIIKQQQKLDNVNKRKEANKRRRIEQQRANGGKYVRQKQGPSAKEFWLNELYSGTQDDECAKHTEED